MADSEPSFMVRHEFLIRRLHSLSGLIPVGAFVCVHLLVNASVVNSPETFQNNVHMIHALDTLLPLVEWVFIFLPILFHGIVGMMIVGGMIPNNSHYRYGANWRYTLQRITGVIAFVFIFYHVFHMHGWFHADWWLNLVERWGGAQFKPYNASSTASMALQNLLVALIYAIGVLSTVYHLANGIWTMGITWGVWTTPRAQARALVVCGAFGVLMSVVGLSALWGIRRVDSSPAALQQVIAAENRMYDAKVEAGLLPPNEHKRLETGPAEIGAETTTKTQHH